MTQVKDYAKIGWELDLVDLEEIPVLEPSVERARTYYPEMKGFRLKTWRSFVPGNGKVRDLYSGRDGYVPDEVIKSIRKAESLGVFRRIEIWHAELDPIAVGVVDGRYFRIVWWGYAEHANRAWVYFIGTVARVLNPRSRAAVRRMKQERRLDRSAAKANAKSRTPRA